MKVDDTRIQNVRAHCPESVEPLHARLRLSHLLGTADFRPSGLPPQAILLLRRLRAPRPLSLDSLRVPVDWEQSLRGEVDRLLQSAVRPVRGKIPTDAEAVLFADYAELLACLGLIVLRPDSDSIWVWQSSVGTQAAFPASDMLIRVWRASPRDLPATLFHLDRWGEAVSVLQALHEPDIISLIAVVTAEASLPIPPATSFLQTIGERPSEDTIETGFVLPLWWQERPSAELTLSPAAQFLLDLARTVVTTSSLTQRRTLLAAIQTGQQRAAVPPVRDVMAPPASHVVPSAEMDNAIIFPAPDAKEEAFAREVSRETRNADAISFQTAATEIIVSEVLSAASETASPARQEEARTPIEGIEKADTNSTQKEEENALWYGLTGTPTQFGGVFYLLNLFLRCDAPACFEAEFGLSDHLTLWGLLQGFAEALLDEEEVRLAKNDAALKPSAGAELRTSAGDKPLPYTEGSNSSREMLVRPRRWPLLAAVGQGLVPCRGFDPASDSDPLWELLARLDGREPAEPIAPHLPNREETLHAVYTRLQSELNLLLTENSVTELLCRPAVIYTTRTHMDVVMALDTIWLPARRAGLDASPGWIPDLMRVVLFHFV